jgi:hypothetical protein
MEIDKKVKKCNAICASSLESITLHFVIQKKKKHLHKNTLHFVIENKKINYILLFRGSSKLNKVNVLSALIFYAAAAMKIK